MIHGVGRGVYLKLCGRKWMVNEVSESSSNGYDGLTWFEKELDLNSELQEYKL